MLIDLRSFIFSLLIKGVSTLAVCAVAFGIRPPKALWKNCLLTLSVSFVFSGMMTAIYQLFRPPQMLIVNDIVYFEIDPLLLLVLTGVIYGLVWLSERIFRERLRHSVVRLHFTVNGCAYECMGKIDTGCSLCEPFSGDPVIVADSSVLTIPEDAPGRRVIPCSTVGGSSLLYAVPASSVIIDGAAASKSVYIAQGQVRNSAYQAVIHSDIIR